MRNKRLDQTEFFLMHMSILLSNIYIYIYEWSDYGNSWVTTFEFYFDLFLLTRYYSFKKKRKEKVVINYRSWKQHILLYSQFGNRLISASSFSYHNINRKIFYFSLENSLDLYIRSQNIICRGKRKLRVKNFSTTLDHVVYIVVKVLTAIFVSKWH